MLVLLFVHDDGDVWLIYAVLLVRGFSYVLIDAGETAILPSALPASALGGVNGWRSSALTANSGQILDLLLDLRDERNLTVLLATHERSAATRCDRLLRLSDGRLVEDIGLTAGEWRETTLTRADRLRL